MTNEEKELLLKDLCARLPYGVIVKVSKEDNGSIKSYNTSFDAEIYNLLLLNGGYAERGIIYHYSQFSLKPYLRPMESMTEEERKEWFKQSRVEYDCEFHTEPTLSLCNCHLSTDWLNKKMFDYRGLIPMGLALPAKEGMYNKMEE